MRSWKNEKPYYFTSIVTTLPDVSDQKAGRNIIPVLIFLFTRSI